MEHGDHRVVIRAARLFDARTGQMRAAQAVIVQAGRIAEVRPWGADLMTGDAQVLDLGDATLLPGLIDVHAHLTLNPGAEDMSSQAAGAETLLLRAVGNAQAALRAGVTTVCDAGGPNPVVFAVRDAIRDGVITGPRVLASGYAITTQGGHGTAQEYEPANDAPMPASLALGRYASSADEMREAVRAQVEAGADFIKIMATGGGGKPASQYSLAELQAGVAEARRLGKRVIAHCHGTAGIRDAVAAGVTRVEHCTFMEGGESIFDPQIAAEMVQRGIYCCPTNAIDYRSWERLAGLPEATQRLAPRGQIIPTWRSLYQSGVRFVAGSDAGTLNLAIDDYALILELMVRELGLTPAEAILSGTRVAAEALGLEGEFGTLEAGRCADILAVDGDPLADISALRKVRLVMSGGRIARSGGNGMPDTL